MNKEQVFAALVQTMESELFKAIAASRDAAAYATDDEARAESKWDTQGLEASYLAAGQAEHAQQLAQALDLLKTNQNRLTAPQGEAALGALIACDVGGAHEYFFLAPTGGGYVLTIEGEEVTVISPQSPVARRLVGKGEGEKFTLASDVCGEIIRIS